MFKKIRTAGDGKTQEESKLRGKHREGPHGPETGRKGMTAEQQRWNPTVVKEKPLKNFHNHQAPLLPSTGWTVWELLACLQARSGLWLTLEDWLTAHRRSKQNCKEIQVLLHILWDKLEPFISCINRQVRIELCSNVGYSTWRLYELLLHCQDQTGKDPRAEGSIQAYGFRSFKSTVIGKASRVVFTAVGASDREFSHHHSPAS